MSINCYYMQNCHGKCEKLTRNAVDSVNNYPAQHLCMTDEVALARASVDAIRRYGGRVHMVGVLGAGMSPLARLLVSRGVAVSGSDMAFSTDRAVSLGIPVTPHTSSGLSGTRLFVYSLAVPSDSPELVYARENSIPAVSRAALLGALMLDYSTAVTVSGTHGKSTTVAMLDLILRRGGCSATVISGATLTDGESFRLGGKDILLAEACEYKNAYHHLAPTHALITNIELDHPDFFRSETELYNSFLHFSRRAGTVYLNLNCPTSRRLSCEREINAVTYGTPDSDYPVTDVTVGAGGSDFTVRIDGTPTRFHLPAIGRGNLYDALGAIAVCCRMGVPVSNIVAGIADFSGIGRRLEYLGTIDGRPIYYDYAHHPTEIANTLDALASVGLRPAVIFRPHTYSRTAGLFDSFASVLRRSALTVVLDIFAARESPIDGVDASALAGSIGGGAIALASDIALDYVLSHSDGGIVLMGAGDVDGILHEVRGRLD